MSENIYNLVGGNSYYQYFMMLLIVISQFNTGLNVLIPIFINNYQDFLCNVGTNNSEQIFNQHRTQFKSVDNTTGILVINSQRCLYMNITDICSEIFLKKDPMTSTIRSQYHLLCEYHGLSSVATLMFMIGICLGSLIGGPFVDRFGKIAGCMLSYFMISIFSTIAAVSPWFALHAAARLFVGFAVSVSFVSNSGMALEISELKQRTNFGFYWSLGYDCGYIILIIAAFFVRNHFFLQITISCITYVSLAFPFFYKESFRWLLANKKYEKAKRVLTYIARFNKKDVTKNQIEKAVEIFDGERLKNLVKTVSFKEVLKFKVVLLNLLILWYIYFACSFSYYTFVLGSSKITDHIFEATSMTACSGIIVRVIYMKLCRRFGRIPILLSLQVGVAILLIGSIVLKYFFGDKNLITTALLMVSISLSSTNFGFMWTYGGEAFPTVIRGTSVSIGSACARVAGMIASQMEWVFEVSPYALPTVGAIMAVIGSLCTLFFLPETFNRPSLDFLSQAEKYFVEWRQPWRKAVLEEKKSKELFDI